MTRTRPLVPRIISGLAVAAAVTLIGLVTVVPRLTGGRWLSVLTGSMGKAMPAGSLVLVKPVDPATIHAGDVITWQVRPGEATYITHRVVQVHDGEGPLSFVTKGDANRGEDPEPVRAGAVRGKVLFDVPLLGTVRDGLPGAGLMTATAAVLFLLVARRQRSHVMNDEPEGLVRR